MGCSGRMRVGLAVLLGIFVIGYVVGAAVIIATINEAYK